MDILGGSRGDVDRASVTPLRFHRIFLDDPIPEEFEGYWSRFKELNPNAEFFTWNDSGDLGWMRNRREFDEAKTDAGRSDILRYEILATFGGIYVDTDVEPLRPFDDFLDERPFIGWEDDRLLCPTVMGAPPNHPAILGLLGALPVWFHKYAGAPPNRQTGPYFVTRYLRGRSDVHLLPTVTFYPVHWSSKRDLGGPYPAESYSVHHWAAQWIPGGPPQRAG
jgi:mannosyltransferase OCH1-like enzyme